jgi:hypothetical protein
LAPLGQVAQITAQAPKLEEVLALIEETAAKSGD